ncbi:hypothetical protein HZA56_00920 [Candidatus Poribacteria bacterium]|nr:hypothetical protein [Candidatus Poribacteria bacterium]
MNEHTQQQIADSLETTPELLHFMPELLADIWELGGSPGIVVNMLRPFKLPARKAKVLDLGCGKGAVAVTLAKELGFRVFGVDLLTQVIGAVWLLQRAESGGAHRSHKEAS